MTIAMRMIEVAETTADRLQSQAEAQGLSVTALLEQLLELDAEPYTLSTEEAAELDRRWRAVEAGEPTIPHDEVAAWLRTWGTPSYRPWDERSK